MAGSRLGLGKTAYEIAGVSAQAEGPETDGSGPSMLPPKSCGFLHEPYGLWHDAGRSAAGPVHWPLCPAPLPPLVGGLGEPNAGPVVVSMPAVTSAIAAVRNRRFLI
jgi:hypothetical protein